MTSPLGTLVIVDRSLALGVKLTVVVIDPVSRHLALAKKTLAGPPDMSRD
jgi:hypothetical protein